MFVETDIDGDLHTTAAPMDAMSLRPRSASYARVRRRRVFQAWRSMSLTTCGGLAPETKWWMTDWASLI